MSYSESLSLEQKFELRLFADQVRALSPEQVQELTLELYQRMMLKDNLYEELLENFWGNSSSPLSA